MEFSVAFTNNFKHSKVASENSPALCIRLALESTINTNNQLSQSYKYIKKKKKICGVFQLRTQSYTTLILMLSCWVPRQAAAPIRVVTTEMHLSFQDTENPMAEYCPKCWGHKYESYLTV